MVEDHKKKLSKGRSWAARYDERAPNNPYDDPDQLAEDENGNPVQESNMERNNFGHLQKPAAPMPAESEVFEPESARNLDRPLPVEDEDSDEEFYGPDHGTGEAPGSSEASRRGQTGHAAKVRKMVTGTNSKQSRKMQQDGRARFEQEQLQRSSSFDQSDSFYDNSNMDVTPTATSNGGGRKKLFNRKRADSNPYRADATQNGNQAASSRDAVEVDPDSLQHDF